MRERCLRAAAAWDEMAERVRRTENMRATLAAEKQRLADGGRSPEAAWPNNIEHKKPKTNEEEQYEGTRTRVRPLNE